MSVSHKYQSTCTWSESAHNASSSKYGASIDPILLLAYHHQDIKRIARHVSPAAFDRV